MLTDTKRSLADVVRSHVEIQKILRDEIATLQSVIEENRSELSSLAQQLSEAQRDADEKLERQISAIQKRHAIELQLQHVLYSSWRDGPAHGVPDVGQQIEALSKSSLFDAAWYLDTYPDVTESGISPQEHYAHSGAFEGRNPGPEFNTMNYYLANPDIAEMGWPALVHYALFGQAEGRALS